jgi:hypothetical protein
MRALRSPLLAVIVGTLACSSTSRTHEDAEAAANPADPIGSSEDGARPDGSGGRLDRPDDAAPAGDGGASHAPLFVGRFDTTDPKGPRATWPGARILARFEGTAVSVTMSEFAEEWMEGAPSFWEVRIDKGEWTPIEMIADDTPHVFELAKELPPGDHEVELFKRSETQTGMTQFLGFDFHGGRSLPPPPRQARKIEIMGDSQSTGFGIEMLNAPNHDCPGADHSGRWQNFRKAWGAILGERYDAEVHGIVFSGKGLIKNIWPDDPDSLVRYYPRTNPNPALQNSSPQLFDFSSWVPDVIVLTQGSVDFSAGVDHDAFRTAYRDFVVNTLRARGPNAHIFMSVLGRGGRGTIPPLAEQIKAERAAVGDNRMHVFVAKDYVWTEMVACNGHGTPEWHQRIAGELAEAISKATGWN